MGKPKNKMKKSGTYDTSTGNRGETVQRGTFHGINKIKKKKQNDLKYKQFLGNKKEGQGFADKRKSKVVHEYQKLMRKERQQQATGDRVRQIYAEHEHDEPRSKKKMKMSAFKKAEMVWKEKEEEKEKRRQEIEEDQKQRAAALAKYDAKKKVAHKKLTVRNRNGQLNMASQMSVLLGKIKQSNT